MARMSDPQMVDAFIASRTWPGPGSGSGRSRISVLELPGRKTPRMSEDLKFSARSRDGREVRPSHHRTTAVQPRGPGFLDRGGLSAPRDTAGVSPRRDRVEGEKWCAAR